MSLRSPPAEFSSLSTIPHTRLDIRYGTTDNFMGRPISGYGALGAWFRAEGVEQLRKLALGLEKQGLGIIIWDAYRPRRATLEMVQWAKETGQKWLLEEGYLVYRSRHNAGGAVDLNFYDLQTGIAMDMGTEWDHFSEASHVHHAEGQILENRLFLQQMMRQAGFSGYETEWWHFELPDATSFPLRDVPYGADEADEDSSICE